MPERTITWAKSFFSHRDRERTRRIEALKLRNRVEPWAESPFKESMLSTFVQIRCWCHLLRLLGYSASLTSTCYDLDDHVRNFPILHRDSRTCSLKISRFADKWLSTRKQFYIYSGHCCTSVDWQRWWSNFLVFGASDCGEIIGDNKKQQQQQTSHGAIHLSLLSSTENLMRC